MKLFSIGVDIGGTGTVCGLVTHQGEIVETSKFSTQDFLVFGDYADELARHISDLIGKADGKVTGIGVGAPCGNGKTGIVEDGVYIKWGNVNFVEEMERRLPGYGVKLTNDANAAALGEHFAGAARGMDNFIELTLGTGVGSGIFVNGELLLGNRGMAGELGHLRYGACGDRLCGCGREGCLDSWCSARGVVITYCELNPQCPLLSSEEIANAARQGDPKAIAAFQKTAEVLGNAIADMVTFSDPEAVILFGGLVKSADLLLEPTRMAFERNVLPMYKDVEILISEMDDSNVAILGAASLGVTQ